MSGVQRRLIFGPQHENIPVQLFALKLIYEARITSGVDDAHQDDSARCYRNIAHMRTHYGMRDIDDEFRLAVTNREILSSMPKIFVVDVANIIASYI